MTYFLPLIRQNSSDEYCDDGNQQEESEDEDAIEENLPNTTNSAVEINEKEVIEALGNLTDDDLSEFWKVISKDMLVVKCKYLITF